MISAANAGTLTLTTLHDNLVQERTGLYVVQIAALLAIVGAVLAIMVVRRITAASERPAYAPGQAPPLG